MSRAELVESELHKLFRSTHRRVRHAACFAVFRTPTPPDIHPPAHSGEGHKGNPRPYEKPARKHQHDFDQNRGYRSKR